MSYYYLEITRGVEVGKRYALTDGAITIGRGDENAICLHEGERYVSNHHAILYKDSDSFSIQDMASKNGLYLNDKNITQEEVSIGDEIGFGEKGPRLKLICSAIKLSSESNYESSQVRSQAGESNEDTITTERPTQQQQAPVKLKSNYDLDTSNKSDFGKRGVFLTSELENKLLSNKINANEMASLMKQGARVEKIMQKGNLNEAQVNLLNSAYGAHQKFQKQTFIFICTIIGISLVVISFFTVQMLRYKAQVNKAMNLEEKLNGYDDKIAQAQTTGASTDEIATLVKEFEKTKGQFNNLKTVLNEDDLQRFYQDTVEMFLSEILSRFGETDYHIPPQMIESVKHHINTYSKPMKPTVSRFLTRKEVYFPMIRQVFTEKRVPIELAYVSMLESGFNPKALSHVGARGLWQFMPKTGRQYGLVVTDSLDDRIDPQKATYAAAEHLKDLIAVFGGKSSIMLAIAAYNAGTGRIMGALQKIDDPMHNRDFWYIYRMGYLAEETNEYIPRILALMIIDENQEYYGFKNTRTAPTESLYAEDDFIPIADKIKLMANEN